LGRNDRDANRAEVGRARDELFSHIHRCGVLRSNTEQQTEWMNDTVEYLGERFTSLSQADLDELRDIGVRFCQPVIDHGAENTALSPDSGDSVVEEVEEVGVAEEANAA
jgi:hypothetical protein